jgi:hypothetical protein
MAQQLLNRPPPAALDTTEPPAKKKSKRSFAENRRAIARAEADGLVPVADLCRMVDTGPGGLVRWIVTGWQGLRLDGVKRGDEWYTSTAAVARFLSEYAALVEARGREALDRGDIAQARVLEARMRSLKDRAVLVSAFEPPGGTATPGALISPLADLTRAQLEQMVGGLWCALVLILSGAGATNLGSNRNTL